MSRFVLKSLLTLACIAAPAMAAPPIEKSGPCTLARTNFYNGIDLRAFNDLSGTAKNFANNPGWPIRPDTSYRNAGLIQEPLPPELAINCVITPPGLKPQIVASENTPGPVGAKGMAYPLFFNFDEKGRMWVVDAVDYPYTHDSTGMPAGSGISTSAGLPSNRLAGKSRILIFEDTDGNGSLDKFKIFYEGFALANSLEFVKGGIIVMVPPNVYYVPKSVTNPDTAGGAPTIVVQGLGSSTTNYDSHGQANSLTRGIDNWIYGHTGYNGCGGTGASIANATGATRSGSCDNGYSYRFKHVLLGSDTSRFETRSSGSSNAHGIGTMEDGQIFKSAATGSTHNQHDVRPGTAALDIRFSSASGRRDRTRLYSLTSDRYMWEGNNDTITPAPGTNRLYYSSGISAVSGSDFYTARVLPSKYNRFQFACEGLSGLCNQDSLTVNNSTWRSNRLIPGINYDKWPNIFASSDAWSAPLKVRTAPDGSLYVLDFYNYVFLHNPAQPATNAAYRHPLRYKTRARFYRILPDNGATQPVLDLSNATNTQLVAALYNSNLVWRMHAQRLLIDKGYNTEVGAALQTLLTTRRVVDDAELDGPVINAIWTLQGMGQFQADPTRWNPILKQLLLHPAWTVRRNVLLAMPSTAASFEAIRDQCAANDEHPHVRLQALDNLNRMPVSGALPTISGAAVRLDTYATAAFNAANSGTAHVDSTSTAIGRPGTCPAYMVAVGIKAAPGQNAPYRFSQDVRFKARVGGFDLISNADLPSGDLVVFDMRGKVAFRSVWNQSTQTWSASQARSLEQPVYFYTFRGNAGQSFKGRIGLNAGI